MIRKDFVSRSLADGTELTTPVFYFEGTDKKNAPSIYIQSSVHGAEIQGYAVCLQLIEYYQSHPPRGNVTIVPMANPYGTNQKMGQFTFGRFDPVTGDNWNRHYYAATCLTKKDQVSKNQIVMEDFFKDCEKLSIEELKNIFKQKLKIALSNELSNPLPFSKKLNYQLQLLASESDIMLDLHCDTHSLPHLYSASYAVEESKKLHFPFIIDIPAEFSGAMDEACFMPWVHFYQAFHLWSEPFHVSASITPIRNHFLGVTLELGDEEIVDWTLSQQQLKKILNYLNHKMDGIQLSGGESQSLVSSLDHFINVYAPVGGIVLTYPKFGKTYAAGETLIEMSTLCKDAINENQQVSQVDHRTQICVPYSCIPITVLKTSIAHEGMSLMKVVKI